MTIRLSFSIDMDSLERGVTSLGGKHEGVHEGEDEDDGERERADTRTFVLQRLITLTMRRVSSRDMAITLLLDIEETE